MTDLKYANQNLQNRSFKAQDLTGMDFSGSDLRGCDFTAATLTGANFTDCVMGQSRRQRNQAVGAAIAGPLILLGVSAIIAQISITWFSHLPFNSVLGILSILVLAFGYGLRDWLNRRFPSVTQWFAIAALSTLLGIMLLFTIGLLVVGVLNLGEQALMGLFLLLLMVAFGFLSWQIFQWLLQSIQSNPGTCFRKASLTDATFNHATLYNADFQFALLTGACICNCAINAHTQFANVSCDYLYLAPAQQNRQPPEGRFQPEELSRVLAKLAILES